ncbi:MAG TPA: hypothetical protein PLD20_13720 [Blastocatellia bacterium]|nr:hypothetical protein [Blastocatellia bacterium]HMV85747.1 hypothetical protein [Blastocatellia bacterium]HMX26775.1 hypothetical protein [Blastocatellia bacterium]HMY73731.1 hypothetical protein [Blastocatellia bacterium]HMZ18989.1 hypothetical protein [Blastocatellia bacterium]
MTEKQTTCDPVDYVIDSFWALLPEKTADDVATFKKDVLKGFRSLMDSVIDSAIAGIDRHVENARRMRQEWDEQDAAADAADAADAPPNPA